MFDHHTRQLIAQEPAPAKVGGRVVSAAGGAPHSLRAVARDFQARDIRTRTGLVFSSQHLRSMALSPVYAALRAHRPAGHPGMPRWRWRTCMRGSGLRW